MFLTCSGPLFSAPGLVAALAFFSIHLFGGDVKTGTPNRVKKEMGQSKVTRWLMEDSLFIQKGTLGTITGIACTPVGLDSHRSIVLTGQYGAAYFSDTGELRQVVKFERKGFRMAPVDLKGDGNYAFMNRGGDRQQVGLFDSQGREVWRYGLGMDPAPNSMAAGDIDGDGEVEFVVGMNGDGGIRLLDAHGKERWKQPDVNVWQVEILDVDGDGKNEILHSNVSGRVRIRDGKGKLLREIAAKKFVAAFSVCASAGANRVPALLYHHHLEGIQLMDFSGNSLGRFTPPAKGRRVYGMPVRLAAAEEPYFALLVCDCAPHGDSYLFLYDSDGEIVFEKRLPAAQAALLSVPNEIPGTEKLLVGESEGTVWQIRRKLMGPAQRN